MNKRTLYLYHPQGEPALYELLESLYGTLEVNEALITMTLFDDQEDILQADELKDLIESDFNLPITILETREIDTLYSKALIKTCLNTVPKGLYDLEALLFKVSQHDHTIEKTLKKVFDKVLTQELKKTVLAFASHQMNVSLSAKALYMHRNTMHYRLTSFQQKTHLDPYRFDVLALMYRLYHL